MPPMPTLSDFSALVADYRDTLLLGNGASIAIAPGFGYGSLLDHARAHTLVHPDVTTLFEHFDTADFELVMRLLRDARSVNMALGVAETLTAPAYEALRSALIRSVGDTHVDQARVVTHLEPMSAFMSRFATVLSLNYDLLVYWAIQKGNELAGGPWLKDGWFRDGFDADWRRLREPYRGVGGATLVFYPHGHLTLTTHLTEGEHKVRLTGSAASNLLEAVFDHWASGDRIPLFVSEGDEEQKRVAISRSGYLSTVLNDVMTDIGPSVMIYGWHAGDQDRHILRRVCHPRVERVAMSVHRPDGQSDRDLDLELARLQLRFRRAGFNGRLDFFDAASPGCWHRFEDEGFGV